MEVFFDDLRSGSACFVVRTVNHLRSEVSRKVDKIRSMWYDLISV